ncbi:hypothetical protein A3D78_07250 [Candidatus Gottesmanbacteria bacterium RIFCSPHIGHO2_02_FULL_39_14]|uniref:Uncharacterized protein n=3 Tax=Candidatus Gottesmaniibacteriota TaxID=1752720 RepID=A0A1F6A0I1_9BACT|nr:MAG: hypothetical protein A2153_00280 [Candidatus Gottesmanbacteria bacterium RBG_16_38_7b]OGG17922.1 MAG: hypothetical protein A3D78_07250 [Candidatus Gottesmanbacteria bacterium RIFCSPHIGHO2_02_FULL_39_14]OGG32322.1 MAG: hypothetical protein A3I51_02025 [Candidatus Gottesmanbacteria bacterium RIFCSPLOWO2_02_FULL_38_8]
MTSSRFILALLGLIFIIIVILSSGRILDTLRKRSGTPTQNQVKETQITVTPETKKANKKTALEPTAVPPEGKEIPQTGPLGIAYIILGGGLLTGIAIKRMV